MSEFDEWFESHTKSVFKNKQGCFDGGYKLGSKMGYKAGVQSQQAKIDLLDKELTETQAFLNNQNHIKQAKIDELQGRIDKALSHLDLAYPESWGCCVEQAIGILKGNKDD